MIKHILKGRARRYRKLDKIMYKTNKVDKADKMAVEVVHETDNRR